MYFCPSLNNNRVKRLLLFFLVFACSFCLIAQSTCLCSGGQMNATPFCTDQNPYGLTYAAGTSGYATELYSLTNTGCLDRYTGGENPAWFKMRISQAGTLNIRLTHTAGGDIDYACWGPFTDNDMATMCSSSLSTFLYDHLSTDYPSDYSYAQYYYTSPLQYFSHHPTYVDNNAISATYGENWMRDWYNPNPSGKLVDCSATPSPSEWVHIRNAQVGQWYIILISNWAGASGSISFISDNSSTAETDCSITAPVTGDEVCEGEDAVLTAQAASGAVYYTWTKPNGTTTNTTTNTLVIPNASLADAGTYSMRVWNGGSYGQVTQCQLIVHPTPAVAVASVSICMNETATLTATGASTYQWSTGNAGTSLTVMPLTTTTYFVTGTSSDGCVASDSAVVTVNPIYAIELFDTICQGENYNRYGFSITANTSGSATYQQELQTATQCDSTVTLHLLVNPAFVYEYDTSFCEGEELFFFGETYSQSGSYEHRLPSADGCDSVVRVHLSVYPHYATEDVRIICKTELPYHYWPADTTFGEETAEEGVYRFARTSSHGCDSIITLQLSVVDNHFELYNLTEDFCQDRQAVLQVVTELQNIFWNTGETTPEITVHRPGTYIVTAYTGACRESAQLIIPRCDFDIFLPNAITPSNNDGINDVFCLPEATSAQISDVDIYIFDRWGRVVFHSNDPFFHWDGTSNGKILSNCTFTYRFSYKDFNGIPQMKKGIVTVL